MVYAFATVYFTFLASQDCSISFLCWTYVCLCLSFYRCDLKVIDYLPKMFLLIASLNFRLHTMKVLVNLAVILLAFIANQRVESHGVQPLSLVQIDKAVVALNGEAFIKASPSLLGIQVSFFFLIFSSYYQDIFVIVFLRRFNEMYI